jgi:hypothetical protein
MENSAMTRSQWYCLDDQSIRSYSLIKRDYGKFVRGNTAGIIRELATNETIKMKLRTLTISVWIGLAAVSVPAKAALGKSLTECVKLYGPSVSRVNSETLEFQSKGWNISASINAERICEKLVYSHVPTSSEVPKITGQEIEQLLTRNGFHAVLAETRGVGRKEQTWYSVSTSDDIDRIGVTGMTLVSVIGGGTFEGQVLQLETVAWASSHDPGYLSKAPQKQAEPVTTPLAAENGPVRHEPPDDIKPYIEPSAFATPTPQMSNDDKIRAENEKAFARLASSPAATGQAAPTPQPQSVAVSTENADGPLELVSIFRESLKAGTDVSASGSGIEISYNIKNTTPKAIKLTHAAIEFRDLLDAPLLKIAVEEDKLYPANETTYLTGTYRVVWDTRGGGRLLSLSPADIKAVLIVDAVMFEDGSAWKKASP